MIYLWYGMEQEGTAYQFLDPGMLNALAATQFLRAACPMILPSSWAACTLVFRLALFGIGRTHSSLRLVVIN